MKNGIIFTSSNKTNDMNAVDLKSKRNEIISRINEIADNSKTNEIMTAMLRIAEAGMNEANNPVDLVNEVVTLMGYEKKYTGRHSDDIAAEAMRNQRSSSMR